VKFAHEQIYKANAPEPSSKRRKSKDEVEQPAPVSKLTQDSFKMALANFVVQTNQPFSVVESPALRDLVELISKDKDMTSLPGRTQMTTIIQQQYLKCKQSFTNELFHLKSKVSLVIDCWTSSNGLAFQGVVARFIDDSWNLCTLPLDLTLLSGPHYGENIAHAPMKVVDEFGITEKIGSITTDNASNMDSFFTSFANLMEGKGQIFDVTNQRIRCLAHIINLSAKDAIECFEKSRLTF